MARDKLTEYSATASENTVCGDVNIAENSALPSDMNNYAREIMSHLKEFADGTNGINVLSLADDDASAAIKFQAPSAVTATVTFTLPDGDGSSGQTLVTNGSGTLSWHAPYGNRNLIINGAMQIAQRGTSNTGKTTSHFVTDRFDFEITNAGTWTTSQSSTSPAQFSNSLKADCTTADSSLASGDLLRIVYLFEGQDMQHLLYGESTAKALILSFWVRSNKTGTYNIQFQQADNSYKQVTKSFTINTADTWEQKEVTIPGDTAGVINNDNGEGFRICWVLAAGSTFTGGSERSTWTTFANADVAPTQTVNLADSTSNEFYLTGVQLEVGEQATPFEHRSYGDVLWSCKRYFNKIGGSGDWEAYPSQVATSTGCRASVHWDRRMRARPSITWDNGSTNYVQARGNNYTITGFTTAHYSDKGAIVDAASTSMTQGDGSIVLFNTHNQQEFDAEL